MLVFAQEDEDTDELSTTIRVIVIDYRGGRDWRLSASNLDREGIFGVEISIFIDGELFDTVVTDRHGTASMLGIMAARENPPTFELQIVQADGFDFDCNRIPIKLENIYCRNGREIYAFRAEQRIILHPISPDLPLGGADLQWVIGGIRVLEHNLEWSDFFEGYAPVGCPIIGAKVNLYLNGDLFKTVTMEGIGYWSSVSIEIPLPMDAEVETVALRLVQADGFIFDSEKIPMILRPVDVDGNVMRFWTQTWSLHPEEAVVAYSPIPAPNLDTASSWAQDGIAEAVALSIVPQAMQNNYRNNTTRAEFTAIAVLLYETITGTEITGRVTFNDTTDVNIEKAAYLGIIAGTGSNNFSPNMQFNRQQAAVIIVRLAAVLNQPLQAATSAFVDNAEIASWAREQAGQVQAAGIMEGVGGSRFNPTGTFTREQSILTMLRLFYMLN